MLTIRHLNGAQPGSEVKIADKTRVVVGRQLDCDVQYPPEETAVARHHFALVKKPSGSWTMELFGTPFVAVDGTPADNGQVVRDDAKIELGRIGGPAFSIGITDDARAVYHVQLQDAEQRIQSGGTAWVVGPNLLATNAHVAILREGLRPRERMIVRAPGQNGTTYEVVEHRLHPGYVPFNAFLQSDVRLIGQYRGGGKLPSGNGYDGAILRL